MSRRSWDALKTAVIKEWDNISMDHIRACCAAGGGRLEHVIAAEGGDLQ